MCHTGHLMHLQIKMVVPHKTRAHHCPQIVHLQLVFPYHVTRMFDNEMIHRLQVIHGNW